MSKLFCKVPAPLLVVPCLLLIGMSSVACVYKDFGGDYAGESPERRRSMEPYLDGSILPPGTIEVHADAKTGQYWKTALRSDSDTQRSAWLVAQRKGDYAVIEHRKILTGPSWLLAYLVKLPDDVDSSDGRTVLRAWIAKRDEPPVELEVGEPQNASTDVEANLVSEKAFEIDLTGRTWSGTARTYESDNGQRSTFFLSEDGWFNGIVRIETVHPDGNTSVFEVISVSEDRNPWVDWDKVDTRPDFRLDENGKVVPRNK